MAAELQKQFGGECELIKSSGGVFEVEIDGKLIFSKASLGRFPEEGEVARLISAGQ